ncbi:VirC2 family conjugal transfer protein [Roseibium sp.]|uniref:VirC2 family conjugal transfer protein n=1 Tax=Roseibium sp. TaxID=1936156 RepID=UPI003B5017BC
MAIKKPTISYKEHREKMRQEKQTVQPDPGTPEPAAEPVSINEQTENVQDSQLSRDQADAQNSQAKTKPIKKDRQDPPKKITIPIIVPLPQPGVSDVFDDLVKTHSPKEATLLILSKAVQNYCEAILDKSFKKIVQDYPALSETVETTRMLPAETVEKAKAFFDPHGLYATRKLGRKIGTAALAAYFENENPK